MIPLVSAEVVAFWVFAPLTVIAAIAMVLARKPVYSALCLAGLMICLAGLYASLDAPFLFVAQIIVYTGAIMMLFVFTMMMVGVDTVDEMIETIRGQRVAVIVAVLAFLVLIGFAVGHGIVTPSAGLGQANAGGNVQGLAQLVFGRYVFAFEATAALLITAALAAMVLAHHERLTPRERQPERVRRRTREFAETGAQPGPLPGPGVYARHNSADYPALLPDGSVSELSRIPTLVAQGVAVVEAGQLKQPVLTALRQVQQVHEEALGNPTEPEPPEADLTGARRVAAVEAGAGEASDGEGEK